MLKTVTNIINASQIATPISLPGNVTLSTGNLVIGTAGKGIDFSIDPSAAGMTSELLADYEEGTWTPIFYPAAGAFGSITYNFLRAASYTKIGRLVTIQMSIGTDAISIGTASGDILILGLPFTPISRGALAVGVSSAFNINNPCNAAIEGGVIALYARSTSIGSNTALQASSLGTTANSNYLTLNGSYIV
jgi:hypothetical protein